MTLVVLITFCLFFIPRGIDYSIYCESCTQDSQTEKNKEHEVDYNSVRQ